MYLHLLSLGSTQYILLIVILMKPLCVLVSYLYVNAMAPTAQIKIRTPSVAPAVFLDEFVSVILTR